MSLLWRYILLSRHISKCWNIYYDPYEPPPYHFMIVKDEEANWAGGWNDDQIDWGKPL